MPVGWALAAGEGAREPLAAGRDWLARNNADRSAAAVLLVIGAMLVGSGIEGCSSLRLIGALAPGHWDWDAMKGMSVEEFTREIRR